MKRDERTSARVAKIAAKVMAMTSVELNIWLCDAITAPGQVRALAASALTQAPNRKSATGPARIKGVRNDRWPRQRVRTTP